MQSYRQLHTPWTKASKKQNCYCSVNEDLFCGQITSHWSGAVCFSSSIQWTVVLQSCCIGQTSLLEVFNGTRCCHVPHATCSCPLVTSYFFDQGTLLRRVAFFCTYSTVCALAPWGDSSALHYKSSSVNKLWISWLRGTPSVLFLPSWYTLCSLWKRCLLSECLLCSVKIKHCYL